MSVSFGFHGPPLLLFKTDRLDLRGLDLEKMTSFREATWPSGLALGRWISNLEVPGSNPPPYCYLDLLSVVPSSTPRPHCVNS